MNKKDLITDILQYLKDNEEARERFNKHAENNYFVKYDVYSKMNYIYNADKLILIITALSSLNEKPICGFLEESIKFSKGEYFDDEKYQKLIKGKVYVLGDRKLIINHAKTLLNTFMEHISNGEGFEESYKKVNEKYNKLSL